jgi:hypothetical protein
MERVMIVEDHSAFAQALELVLEQVDGTEVAPQTTRRTRELASRSADTESAGSLPRRTNLVERNFLAPNSIVIPVCARIQYGRISAPPTTTHLRTFYNTDDRCRPVAS